MSIQVSLFITDLIQQRSSLDSVKTALVAGELVGFDTHSFQDGDKEMSEGEFMIVGVASLGCLRFLFRT
jgi:hypothetical protein